MFQLIILIFTLSFEALANPIGSQSKYAVKDSHFVPRGWSVKGRAPADHVLNLRIGLRQHRFDVLEKALYEVSDPSHERYGKHMTAADVHKMVQPSEDSIDTVHAWLAESDISFDSLSYSPAKDWIKVALPLSSVERLLDTEYHTYINDEGEELHRTLNWSLPFHLHDHVTTIQPTNSFLRKRTMSKRPNWRKSGWKTPLKPILNDFNVSVCNASRVTPLCLRNFYGTVDYQVKAADRNSMAINNFLGQVSVPSDVQLFLETYRPEAVSGADDYTQVSIAGGLIQNTPLSDTQVENNIGAEGDADAEIVLGIAWPTPLVVYSTGGLNPVFIPDEWTTENTDEPYLVYLEYLLGLSDEELPNVISTSYADDEQTIPQSYATQVCNMIAQLGARGTSFIFGSGDFGVGPNGYCVKNDGSNATAFTPAFPASCPYVTTVGATTNFTPEVAAYVDYMDGSPPFTSGAGFSNYFSRPAYQNRAVSHYLEHNIGDMYAGLYNASGRAYPDVAANGQKYAIAWNETLYRFDGTSASTPTVAAIIALVNDALISAGRPTLGFLNPWLYSRGHRGFSDILSGSSAGCDTDGFPATAGWDACTGWGTPNFPKILAILGLEG